MRVDTLLTLAANARRKPPTELARETETINRRLVSQLLNKMLSARWNMQLWNPQSGTSLVQFTVGRRPVTVQPSPPAQFNRLAAGHLPLPIM